MPLKAKDPKAAERILSRCIKTQNDCIEWTGYRQRNGYGQTSLNGKLMPAHRAMYIASTGEQLSRAQDVCHKCDNRACCNIAHLFVGSRLDNMRDARNKQRHVSITHPESFVRGEQSHLSVLKEQDVIAIKKMLRDGVGCSEIARRYSITPGGVSKIKTNKSWKHVCLN